MSPGIGLLWGPGRGVFLRASCMGDYKGTSFKKNASPLGPPYVPRHWATAGRGGFLRASRMGDVRGTSLIRNRP